MSKTHIVSFSGGIASFFAAKRVVEKYGKENTLLLFADTKMEDEDLYRFIKDCVKYLNVKLETIADGRDVWEVFKDVKFLGNSRIDPCSQILKRKLIKKWIEKNFDVNNIVMHVGLDWTEEHRFTKYKKRATFEVDAPLIWQPYLTKPDLFFELKKINIKPPRLYDMGFPHNNCGGFCVKAGKAQFKILLERMPERYNYHEKKEQEFRKFIDKDVSILTKNKDKVKSNITLKEFREEIESNPQMSYLDSIDWGGCGCGV